MGIGMAWAWTLSLVLGWLFVGTQMKRDAVSKAFERANRFLKMSLLTKEIDPYGTAVIRVKRLEHKSSDSKMDELDASFVQRDESFGKFLEEKLWGRYSVA